MILSAAAGPSINDFFVLSENRDYNELFEWKNPDSFQYPTSFYTHILHYTNKNISDKYRIPDLLIGNWYNPSGKTYICGFPRSVFEIDSTGIQEYILKGHRGSCSGIWGVNEDHIYVCGFEPFILNRKYGNWQYLSIPEGTPDDLYGVVGLNENDVYFVGGEGTILHFDGKDVRRLETPTTDRLLSVAILDDKHVCVGGEDGLLLHGNQYGWRMVPTQVEEELDSLAYFQAAIYFPSPDGVWIYDGQQSPRLILEVPSEWVSGLNDGILIRNGVESWLYDGKSLSKIDTTISDPGP